MNTLEDQDPDRKCSFSTINTDSGICGNNYDSISEADSINDERDPDDGVRDQSNDVTNDVTYRHRVSIDHHEQINSDTNRFVVGKSRHRRSCSLPDILDFENCENIEQYFDKPAVRPPQNGCKSDSSLAIKPPASHSSNLSLQLQCVPLCGKEHVEKPCYICLKDNEIYCNACVQIHNFHCKENVKHIPEIPPEVRANLCSEAVKELKIMKERFDKIKLENDTILNGMIQTRKSFVRSIMACKNKVIEIMDTIEKDALLQMDDIFTEQKNQIEANLKSLETEILSIESYLKILEDSTNDEVNTVVYELQAAMLQIRRDETLIRDIHKATNNIDMMLETLGPLADLLTTDPSSLWSIHRTPSEHCRHPSPCSCDRSYKNKVGVKEKEVSVRLSGWSFDRERCCITGCEFLPNGKMIVCDNGNKKVKLFDRKFKCVSAHSMHALPWDVAVISDDKAVVTIPDRKQLAFLSIGHRISVKKTVTLDQHCWGVAFCENQGEGHIYVTCWSRDQTCVLILDTEGEELRQVKTIQGQSLHTPWFINGYNETMLISDWGTYMLTSSNMAGMSIFSYRKSDLVGPLGITRDPEGTCYVCGRDSNNIHQISADGSENRIFLSENDGIRQPLNICHRESDDKLVVTSWMSDKITIFRLQ